MEKCNCGAEFTTPQGLGQHRRHGKCRPSAASAGYKCKVNVVDIRIANYTGKVELRIDWSNDRHQSIMFNGLDPESIKEGFLQAAHLLNKEMKGGHL